jgi:hypothetical protein
LFDHLVDFTGKGGFNLRGNTEADFGLHVFMFLQEKQQLFPVEKIGNLEM